MEGVYNGSKIIDKRLDLIIDSSKKQFDINLQKYNKLFNPK